MNQFYLHLKPSSMGTEGWAVGEKLKKVWRKHQFLQEFVIFQYMGYGTNMQWVYCVQTDEDRALHPAVPNYFNGVITGVNLEMMERPELLEPPVLAEQWEETTVTCKLNPHKTVRKLKIMSMVQFAKHVQNVQHVPFEFWEILRGVIGAGTDGFVYRPPHVRTTTPAPASRKVIRGRGGHGKSPKQGPTRSLAQAVQKAQEEEQKEPQVLESTGEEEKKTESGKRRKAKKQYSAEEFVHPQPRIKKQPFPIVYRSRKWFNKNHPLVEFKRDDPHKEERERLQACKKAAVERGEEIPVKPRKQAVKAGSEGCSARVGCALNDLYNLERITRTGRCNYYQDFGHKANTVRVGVWCTKCEVGMHRECYYSYHQVRHGVYLDNRYEINNSRRKQGMRKLVSSKAANFQWCTLEPDIHSSDEEVRSHGSQDGRPPGSWEGSENSQSNEDEEEDENTPQNAAGPV